MTDRTPAAWPYAISNSHKAGFQAVLQPDFGAPQQLTSLLEFVTNERGLREGRLTPGMVVIREVQSDAFVPLTVVYRAVIANRRGFGMSGDEPLLDAVGRPIRVLEGLAIRADARRVAEIGITEADLEAAHVQAAEAFKALWRSKGAFPPQTSHQITLDASKSHNHPRVPLTTAEPHKQPIDDAPLGPDPGDDMPQPARRSCSVVAVVITLLLTAAAAGGLAGWTLRGDASSRPTTTLSNTAVPSQVAAHQTDTAVALISVLCTAIQTRDLDSVYNLLTADSRKATSEADLSHQVLGPAGEPADCGQISIQTTQITAPQTALVTINAGKSSWQLEAQLQPPSAGRGWQITSIMGSTPPQSGDSSPTASLPPTGAASAAPVTTATRSK